MVIDADSKMQVKPILTYEVSYDVLLVLIDAKLNSNERQMY